MTAQDADLGHGRPTGRQNALAALAIGAGLTGLAVMVAVASPEDSDPGADLSTTIQSCSPTTVAP